MTKDTAFDVQAMTTLENYDDGKWTLDIYLVNADTGNVVAESDESGSLDFDEEARAASE